MAASSDLGGLLWTTSIPTGTGNRIRLNMNLSLNLGRGAQPAPLSGHLHLEYVDATGYFAGKSTLNAWCKVVNRNGSSQEFRNLALNVVKDEGKSAPIFSVTQDLRMKDPLDEPVAVEVAFSSSDRYGNLKWDSDNGRNYRFTRK